MGLRFRKKPVVIEAFQMTKERRWDNQDWPEWLNRAWQPGEGEVGAIFPLNPAEGEKASSVELCILTLEGVHVVTPGDFIIKGIASELYPCKPEIFEASYEPVD